MLLGRPRCLPPMACRAPGLLGRPKATTGEWTNSEAERTSALVVAGYSVSLHRTGRCSTAAIGVPLELLPALRAARAQMPLLALVLLLAPLPFSVTPYSMPVAIAIVRLAVARAQPVRHQHRETAPRACLEGAAMLLRSHPASGYGWAGTVVHHVPWLLSGGPKGQAAQWAAGLPTVAVVELPAPPPLS